MSPIERFLLFVAAPGVLLFALAEAVVLSRRGGYDWRAFGVSAFDLVARIGMGFLPLSIAAPLVAWATQHRLTTLELDGWLAVAVLFLGQEFCYYWYHRAAHRVRWFWGNHAVHHSPNQLNLSAAFRIGALGKLTGSTLFFVPLIWLGFDVRTVLAVLSLNLLYQFWIHATWIPKLGWLEGIVNTPSAHRVHHASNPEYLDANYGGVLLVFDRLFGTYVPERPDVPCRYGLVKPVTTYHPLRIELVEWSAIARDLLRARDLRTALGRLFGPPDWLPGAEARQRRAPALGAALPSRTTE